MLLLEYFNRIILETLQSRMEKDPNGEKKNEILDVLLADFDGVKMHLSNQGSDPRIITLSISWKCVGVLLKNGGNEDLKSIYGSMVQATPEVVTTFPFNSTLKIFLATKISSPKQQA